MTHIQKRCFNDVKRAIEKLGERRVTENDFDVFLTSVRNVAKRDEAHAAVMAKLFSQLATNADNEFKRYVFRCAMDECCALFDGKTALRMAMLPGPDDVRDAFLKFVEGKQILHDELNMLRMRYAFLFGENDVGNHGIALVQWITGGELMHKVAQRTFIPLPGDDDNARNCGCTLLATAGTFLENPLDCGKIRELGVRRTFRPDVNARYKRLMDVTKICISLKPDTPKFEIKPHVKTILHLVKQEPVVSVGVLYWAQRIIVETKKENTLEFTLPLCLGFVDAVAEFHYGLRWRAVNIIHVAFQRKIENVDIRDKIRENCVEAFASMVGRGAAGFVLEYCMNYVVDRSVDDAHIRGLVKALLLRVKPPFGRQFAIALNRFITHNRVKAVANIDRETMSLVDNFLREMRNNGVR